MIGGRGGGGIIAGITFWKRVFRSPPSTHARARARASSRAEAWPRWNVKVICMLLSTLLSRNTRNLTKRVTRATLKTNFTRSERHEANEELAWYHRIGDGGSKLALQIFHSYNRTKHLSFALRRDAGTRGNFSSSPLPSPSPPPRPLLAIDFARNQMRTKCRSDVSLVREKKERKKSRNIILIFTPVCALARRVPLASRYTFHLTHPGPRDTESRKSSTTVRAQLA